jgi:type II secretory pathway pseudopilin PulG
MPTIRLPPPFGDHFARLHPAKPPVRKRVATNQSGFTLVEVLMAALLLVIGILGLFGALNVAARTTMGNRQRQAETSLAREVIEDARTLAYTQLTPSALAGALQPLMAASSVTGQGLSVIRSSYSFGVTVGVCSLDDPTDGYGDHTAPPRTGGVWCPDVAASGTVDPNPDEEKRLSVTVTPTTGTLPTVQLGTLIHEQIVNGPAVSCLTAVQNVCPGTNQAVAAVPTPSLTFYVTTVTSPAATIRWLVNGDPPASAQIPAGATDPYVPATGSFTSQFTWVLPAADGIYTISAYALDALGNPGASSMLQVTVTRH